MQNKNFFTLFFTRYGLACCLLSLFFSLSACTTQKALHHYTGAPLTEEQLVHIKLPETIEIISIDNQRNKQFKGLLLSGTRNIFVKPGQHQIALFYEALWDISSDEHEVVKSPPVIISFSAEAGQTLSISHKEAHSLLAARKLAKQFSAQAKTNNNTFNSVAAAIVSPLAPISAANIPPALTAPTATTESNKAVDSKTSNKALEQLKYWWHNANTQDKQAFQQWVYQ